MKLRIFILTVFGLSNSIVASGDVETQTKPDLVNVGASINSPLLAFRDLPLFVNVRFTNYTKPEEIVRGLKVNMSPSEIEAYKVRSAKESFCQNMYPSFDHLAKPEKIPVFWTIRNLQDQTVKNGPAIFYEIYERASWKSAWGSEGRELVKVEGQNESIKSLGPGETDGFILNVGMLTHDLPVGKYELSGAFVRSEFYDGAAFGPLMIDVRDPTKKENDEMTAAFGEIWRNQQLHSINGWLCMNFKWERIKATLSSDVLSVCSLYAFLNLAVRDNIDTATLEDVLNSFPSEMKGLELALRYELLIKYNKTDGAAELEKRAASECPESVWQIKRVKENKGLIQRARELKEKVSK